MNTTAEVYLWGTRIGIVHQEAPKAYASFEYDDRFLKSGIEVAPVMMPLGNNIYEFPDMVGEPFHGLPGLLAANAKTSSLISEKLLMILNHMLKKPISVRKPVVI